MRTIRLIAFVSVEGYLVRPEPATVIYMKNYKLQAHFHDSDAILTSGFDYAEVFQRTGTWPFDKCTYVIASSDANVTPEAPVMFITDHVISNIHAMKKKGTGYISVLLSGINSSSTMISLLLEHGLIDEMHLITLPVFSGKKMNEFCIFDQMLPKDWKITHHRRPTGVTESFYSLKGVKMES